MATSPNLTQSILEHLPVDFWEDEASVNGLWNGLLARFFQGTKYENAAAGIVEKPMYIITPEGQAVEGARPLRADLLVCKFEDRSPMPLPVLHFEGKRKSGDSWEQISGQIYQWFSNRGNTGLSGGRNIWAIGAKGKEWKAFVCRGRGQLQSLKLRDNPTVNKVLVKALSPMPYDISTVDGYNKAWSCLEFMSTYQFLPDAAFD